MTHIKAFDQTARDPSRQPRLPPPFPSLLALCAAILLTGCQSLSSPSTTAQIRIVDASPDTPMLDVYHHTGALTYNLAFANITSYIETPPGPNDLSINLTGSHQLLAELHESLLPSAKYTLLVGGTASTLQTTLLKDQSTPAPAGQVALRFLNQINAEAAVDIFLVPSGSSAASTEPILVDQTFAANSGYLTVPSGPYRIVLYPAGATPSPTTPSAYSGPTITYPAGAARTIILLDRKSAFTPALQCIATNDFDPPTPIN